ncbi:MAG: hypothetical protein K2H87_01950, partial [Duncaniella sp.]|nr:hypothetical protein [Duncaniella sp.]
LVVDYSEAVEEQSPFGDGELAAPASVWPKNNAQYLPLNGTIKVAYPEDVTVDVYGNATIGGKECALAVENNVVTVSYEGLDPDTEVTLTIPAKGIGNEEASNAEMVYTYKTAPQDLLFYSDFNNFPYEFFVECPAGANKDLIAKNSTDKTYEIGGMTFFSGTKGRVVALGDNVCSTDPEADYGPYTEADAGATGRAVQLIDGGNGLYFETPEVEGPCDITLYLGNAGAAAGTMLLTDERGLKDTPLAELTFEAAKKIFKYTVNYPYSGPVKFRLYNQKIKVDINDFIVVKGEGAGIPRPDDTDTEAPVMTSVWPGTAPYAPTAGTVTVAYNEPVTVSAKATLDGKELDVVVEGNTVLVAYEGLEAGKKYT